MQHSDDSESTRSTERSRALGEVSYRRRGVNVCLALLLGCCVQLPVRLWCQASFVQIFAPSVYQHVEGPTEEFIPFSLPSSRCQQVFSASGFGSLSNGGWITTLGFRVDTPAGYGFRSKLQNLQINLSTTQRGADQLSTTFADNIGADDTVVFGPNSALLDAIMSIGTPQTFQIYFSLPQWFLYNPADGNLLMDVRLFQGGNVSVPAFDAVNNVGDSISRVYGGIGSASGIRDSSGLVTWIVASPIPEPSALALLLSGATLLGWYRRKQIR